MRSSTNSVNKYNYDLVSGFDESTCLGDIFYDIFESEDENIPEYSTVLVNTYEQIGIGYSLIFLTVTCHSIPII